MVEKGLPAALMPQVTRNLVQMGAVPAYQQGEILLQAYFAALTLGLLSLDRKRPSLLIFLPTDPVHSGV
jgi:hypothetical protein